MTLVLLPSVALADTATSVIAGGKTLDGTTNLYATTDSVTGEVTLQPGYTESDPWNIKFQNGVLTLRGATVAGAAQGYGISSVSVYDYAIYAAGELKLVLVGTNTVYSKAGADVRAGIRVNYLGDTNNGSLTIEGSGSLHAYAAAGGNHVHDGISVIGSLTINSGTIKAEGRSTNGNSFGVRAVTDFVMNGGTLTATGGDVTGNDISRGVNASKTVAINGGTLIATGGTGRSSYGVSSGMTNGITINASTGGTVKVTAKTTDTTDGDYHRAFNQSPVISDGAYYTWSLTENDPNPTPSTTTPYTWENRQTFTELTLGQAVATPALSPLEGAYTGAQNVTLSCATAGATIRYTTDGTEPTERSPEYTAAIPIGVAPTATTVKARAYKSGMSASAVAAAAYTISPVITDPTADRTVPVTVGNTATLSVAAKDALGYQWQQSTDGGATWNDLPATERSYTTAPATLQNNGDQYRCQVTVRDNAETSHIFTLNVTAIPPTGDNSMPGLWLGVLLLTGAALAASLVMRRKRQNG